MKALVIGAGGMLDRDVRASLTSAGAEVNAAFRADIDVTDAASCEAALAGYDVVVNTEAWTVVDEAESHEAKAFALDATGAANVARACATNGAALVHVSTGYVFDGMATTPYSEDATLAPRSAYGRSKAAGEWGVRAYCPSTYIVRAAWLYGEHGPNFVKTMARLATERDTVSVVDDQVGQPTSTVDIADAIVRLIMSKAAFGTYHGASSGETSWNGFTQEIFRLLGHDPARVLPTTSAEFVRPAPRPGYSVLEHQTWSAAGGAALPRWKDILAKPIPLLGLVGWQ